MSGSQEYLLYILCVWCSRIGKTKLWNPLNWCSRFLWVWGGPEKGQKEAHWVIEMFHVLTAVEITQVYIFVQTHLTQLLYKLYFS